MPSQEFLEQHHYHKVELGQFMEEVEVSEIDKLLVEIADLEAKLEAMERFIRAHDAVEIGTVSFDLQHEQVAELQAARFGVDWIGPNAAQQEKEDE